MRTTVTPNSLVLGRAGRLLVAFAAALCGFLGAQQVAHAGTPKYPDLRAMPPAWLTLGQYAINGETHHVMFLRAQMYNKGSAPLEVHRVPQTTAVADLKQRIYEDPVGFRDEPLTMAAIGSPFLFELPDLEQYEVWNARAFQRAMSRDFTRGAPLYVTSDVPHCVADSEQIDEDATSVPVYQCSGAVMGISPGWADDVFTSDPNLVDFGTTPIPDGKYVIRAISDPHNLLWESEGKADPAKESQVANQGVTSFEILNGGLVWQDP